MQARFVAAKLIEIAKRLVKFDESFNIYANGLGNDYPERVERLINNSSTAKPCAKLLRKYIVGQGFESQNDFIVHQEDGTSLRKFLSRLALSYSYQNGVFIHVNYNLEGEKISLKVLPFVNCRIGKKDSKDHHGKILVSENWNADKINDKDIDIIDIYNPRKEVILDQIRNARELKKYKGQVLFFNPEESIYPLSHLDSAINDADSEFRAGEFKNLTLRKGFFGKKLIITPPMVGNNNIDEEYLTPEQANEKHLEETERDNFRKNIQSFMGSDNVDGALHLEMEFEGDSIDNVIKFVDIQSNIDDKLFEYTEKSVSNNIRKAFSNVPSVLIEGSDNSVFGQSGELLKSAKIFYQEQTEEDRNLIENEILNVLLKNFKGFDLPEQGMKIKKLINVSEFIGNPEA
jgi:hypothetical protein